MSPQYTQEAKTPAQSNQHGPQ